MATHGLQQALDRIRVSLAPDLPDELLLRAFIAARDEIAFATLVRRHGPMVLGVSRRILGNLHDAEDVFQATFLVLAQKAGSVAEREALGSWLYKVAYRIALKARTAMDRRRRQETQVDVLPEPGAAAPKVRDWEVFLDEELSRLPAKYRVPIILCDLEGRTRKEVERRLSKAEGTLSSRLATARRLLAERLTRRGLALSAGVLAASLSQAQASVPPGLASATAHQAVLVAAGQLAAITKSVTILMKAGVNAMLIAKLKTTVATVLALAVVATGGLVYSGGGETKRQSEVEALRNENELLRINLRVTLEKIKSLESEVASFKGKNDRAIGMLRTPLTRLQQELLDSHWGVIVDPDQDCGFGLVKDELRIKIPGKAHILNTELSGVLGADRANNAPRVVQELKGDFSMETKVSGAFPSDERSLVAGRWPYYGAGLLVWQDDNNYIRLQRSRMHDPTGGWKCYVVWQLRRHGKIAHSGADDKALDEGKPVFLRIGRDRDTFVASYTQDGNKWLKLPELKTDFADKLRVGATAVQNTPSGYEAVFEYLKTTWRP